MTHQGSRSPIRGLSNKWFELLLVTVVLTGTVLAYSLSNVTPVLLHFFYLPVIIAAHCLGRNSGLSIAVLSVLTVTIFALLDPASYGSMNPSLIVLLLMLSAWGGFLALNALLMGTLSDQRVAHIRELREAHLGIIEVLSKYLQATDQYTKAHSMRVADLAEKTAQKMGLPAAEVENIRVGALLHDIGKVEISTRLIQKAAELSDDEQAEMAAHTVLGAELVGSLGSILRGAIPVIEHHHRHYSGTPNGDGTSGKEIPLGARVVAVADAYDAIVTDRPYRRGRTPQEAIQVIHQAAGTQFDPDVVKAFERVVVELLEEPEDAENPRGKLPETAAV
ncbi:MAG: HD domain-containing phosphohydrolase [Planctomycetota bacterium]